MAGGGGFRAVLHMAVPSMVTQLLGQVVELSNVLWSARHAQWLSGVGVATALVNMFGNSLLQGLVNGFYTLGSQAYGAKNYRQVASLMNKARLAAAVLAVCLFPLFYYAEPLLLLMQVDESDAALAGTFTRITYLGWALSAQGQVLSTFLSLQEVTLPQMLCNILELVVHITLLYLMTVVWGFGFQGVCYATVISQALNCFDMYFLLYCNCRYEPLTFEPIQRSHFRNCQGYIRVAIPAAIQTAAEWLVYDLLVILVVPLGEATVAAQAILVSLQNLVYSFSQGWQDAIQTLVGNAVGAGRAAEAKRVVWRVLLLALLVQGGVTASLIVWGGRLVTIVIGESAVQSVVQGAIVAVSVELFFDVFQGILTATLRSLSYFKAALGLMLLWLYALLLPLCWAAVHIDL